MIEFYLKDLDTKVREFLDLHNDKDFLLKLWDKKSIKECKCKDYWFHEDNSDERVEIDNIPKDHLKYYFVHSAVLKLSNMNLPK